MGVQGLWKLLECTGRPVNPETLEGKILAVDISIWLNQAVKGARDRQGNAVQNAHLLTLFHRLCKLLFFRIRPIFVFDGEAPGLKKRTLAIRRQRKNAAAHDSTKTTDKLLKTFLKRQAIKAVLTGKSDDAVPSLSRVRREEVDDIYLLPALEEQEKHSSDEEEEKEWEERMTQRQLLQEEFFEDPHAVDIESEDFISLPPEVKHEILTDLRELTMRRRTMIEKMPEESDDFSQYQLKGLLKKNTLNQHIKTVQKEMNQQCSGDIQALYENEGGFLKNAESRRVMSEDTSHYILIKGRIGNSGKQLACSAGHSASTKAAAGAHCSHSHWTDVPGKPGLDRNKLINLAYLLGSDYTDGIPTVGCVTAMEILNEFPGHGLEPLIQFRDWWNEAQKNKKIRANPNDTKVKKKLRGLELHQAFPNLAVAEAYLKPVVDDCMGAFSWGRPDLEQIREFCETAFGWYRSKTDEVLLPVLKQLNAQQTQLRIDSFFRLEQHEKRVIKSQRMRRAVTCMQRKEKEGDILEVEEATAAIEQEFKSPRKRKGKRILQDTTTGLKCETGKRNKATNSQPENLVGQVGGFLDVGHIPKPVNSSSSGESEAESANRSTSKQTLEEHKMSNVCQKAIISHKCKNGGDGNRSSSDEDEEEEKTVMVTARSVFKKKVGTSRNVRGRKKKN